MSAENISRRAFVFVVERMNMVRSWFGRLACLGVLLLATTPVLGDDADAQRLFQEQLATGEFAPALAQAESQPLVATRDLWLEALALSQGRAGARSASYYTAGGIQDDRARDRTVREVSSTPRGAQGGGVQPDFQSLIELLTSTIQPTTWTDVGGQGAVKEFRGGVVVDTAGMMRRVKQDDSQLAAIRTTAAQVSGNQEVRQASKLRKISLPRLEKEIQLRRAAGKNIDDAMHVLAGLQRIEYVLVYPETGDLVLAGPAGDWTLDRENRLISSDTGRPVVRLEDFVVLLRHMLTAKNTEFGCSIMPTPEALTRTQTFLNESAKKPLSPTRRESWLEDVRKQMGAQTISVDGIEPQTRVAQVLVEADYRMKLVGIGLEDGTMNVPSYLSMIKVPAGQAPPPLDVLRWWFTMNYDAVSTDSSRHAFQFKGQGVKVLSENELITATGGRVQTGKSDELNREFAQNFTQHFLALAAKYPVYADLQNIFDLALVAALVKSEGLGDQVGWHMTCFTDAKQFPIMLGHTPKTVDTVINHRVINRVHIVAAVSGGVSADPSQYVRLAAIKADRNGQLSSELNRSTPAELPRGAWWWD